MFYTLSPLLADVDGSSILIKRVCGGGCGGQIVFPSVSSFVVSLLRCGAGHRAERPAALCVCGQRRRTP